MPRRSGVPKRDVLPDPIYNSKVVTKLINQIMLDGKKGTAQAIVYEALNIAAAKLGQEPMDIFNKALENAMPMLEVKARRVGGSTYQVPMEIRPERRQTLAIRWIVLFARKRGRKNHGRKTRRRTYGRIQHDRRRSQEKRRNASCGGSEQSVCTLQVVTYA